MRKCFHKYKIEFTHKSIRRIKFIFNLLSGSMFRTEYFSSPRLENEKMCEDESFVSNLRYFVMYWVWLSLLNIFRTKKGENMPDVLISCAVGQQFSSLTLWESLPVCSTRYLQLIKCSSLHTMLNPQHTYYSRNLKRVRGWSFFILMTSTKLRYMTELMAWSRMFFDIS